MDHQAIREKLYEIFAEYSKAVREDLISGQPLGDLVDSIEIAEILFAVEDAFDIEIDDDAAGKIQTFDDVVTAIQQVLGNAAALQK